MRCGPCSPRRRRRAARGMPSASSQPATRRSRTSSRSLTGFVRSRAEVRSTSVVASGASRARSERGSGGPWASTSRRQWSQATRLNEEVPTCEFVINAAEDLAQFEVGLSTSSTRASSSSTCLHAVTSSGIVEFLRVTKPEGLPSSGSPRTSRFRTRSSRAGDCMGSSVGWACRKTGCSGGRR